MSKSSEDLRVKEQTIFYIKECVKNFRELRPNRDRTEDVFSPCLTDISTCSSFQDLIHLCSEHDPKILKSVLQIAVEKCAEAEKQLNVAKKYKWRDKSKKREAETQLGPENYRQAKVQRLSKAHAAPTRRSEVMPDSAPVSKAPLPPEALTSGATADQDSQIVSQAGTNQTPSAVAVQASADSRSQSPVTFMRLDALMEFHRAVSMIKGVVPSDQRSCAENTQDWTGIGLGLESKEEAEDLSDTHQEDSELEHIFSDVDSHDCISTTENASMSPHTRSKENELFVAAGGAEAGQSMETTLESTSMPSPLRSPVTASPSSQETILTNNATKTQAPTLYEVERGLVRGLEKIRNYVMRECLCFSGNCRIKNPAKELRKLFPMFQKLPFEIVKDKVLVELGSRIMVPGQKTAISSTVDLFNPSDILDALQCIKMTTINAKVNRAYGQMRLFKSVQGKINGGYVPDNALTHGVAAHTSILAKMACRSAGNVSEKERNERRHSFDYEYDAGKKWVDVTKWFGGEGIVLIFVAAGEWNQSFLFLTCLSKQC